MEGERYFLYHLKMKEFLVGLTFFLCSLPSYAATPPVVVNGMDFNQVLKLRGQPLEKDFHEARRIVLWRYADTTLTFHDGKLVRQGAPLKRPNTPSQPKRAAVPKKIQHKISQKDVDDIISAIPNEGDTPTGAANTGSLPLNPAQPFQDE